jgi:hypothetical protein
VATSSTETLSRVITKRDLARLDRLEEQVEALLELAQRLAGVSTTPRHLSVVDTPDTKADA